MNNMMDMNNTCQNINSPISIDEESLGTGDEYNVEIAAMSNLEYKFHNQEQFGRLLKKNEFVMFRSRMPMTEHIVSEFTFKC